MQTAVDALGDDNSPGKMLRDALRRPRSPSACDSTFVPNVSRERGTDCPKPTKHRLPSSSAHSRDEVGDRVAVLCCFPQGEQT